MIHRIPERSVDLAPWLTLILGVHEVDRLMLSSNREVRRSRPRGSHLRSVVLGSATVGVAWQ